MGRYSIVFYVVHLGPVMVTLALAEAAGVAGTWLLPLLLAVGVGVPLGLAWVYSTRAHASVDLLFELPALKRRPVVSGPRDRRSKARRGLRSG